MSAKHHCFKGEYRNAQREGRPSSPRIRFALIGALTVIAAAMAGCGERPQVVNYKQGKYQGKPDTPPYKAAPFNGDQKQWDDAIRTRNQFQNEYKRTG